jgi:hypothetical protein
MDTKKYVQYYQFHATHNYPVFIRFESAALEGKLTKMINTLGFTKVEEAQLKKIPVQKLSTKVLTINEATHKLAAQIKTSDTLDKFGHESLSFRGDYQVYLYRHVGLMVFSMATSMWEVGLCGEFNNAEDFSPIKVIINRFLAWSLSTHGVLSYWGTAHDDGFTVMKQAHSFGDAVYVDMEKNLILFGEKATTTKGSLKISRIDRGVQTVRAMNKEELISFLMTQTTYFSYTGIPTQMKKMIMKLADISVGEILSSDQLKQTANLSYA